MVTFVCYHCDKTLKKKQADSHNCRPSAFICIDCHVTFSNGDHKAHISCLTEQEKHWGEFAKKKGPKGQTQNNNNNNSNQKAPAEEKTNQAEKDEEEKPAKVSQNHNQKSNESQEETHANEWKGWKNEIKRILKAKGEVDMKDLKSEVLKRFRECDYEEEGNEEEIVEDKVRKISSVKIRTLVSLNL